MGENSTASENHTGWYARAHLRHVCEYLQAGALGRVTRQVGATHHLVLRTRHSNERFMLLEVLPFGALRS